MSCARPRLLPLVGRRLTSEAALQTALSHHCSCRDAISARRTVDPSKPREVAGCACCRGKSRDVIDFPKPARRYRRQRVVIAHWMVGAGGVGSTAVLERGGRGGVSK